MIKLKNNNKKKCFKNGNYEVILKDLLHIQ